MKLVSVNIYTNILLMGGLFIFCCSCNDIPDWQKHKLAGINEIEPDNTAVKENEVKNIYKKTHKKDDSYFVIVRTRIFDSIPAGGTGLHNDNIEIDKRGSFWGDDSFQPARNTGGDIILSFGYGPWMPLGSFAERLNNEKTFGLSIDLKNILIINLHPGLYFQYLDVNSKQREGIVNSALKIKQAMFVQSYRRDFVLFKHSPGGIVSIFASAKEGVARIELETDNTEEPVAVTNYVFALSFGLTYNIFSGFFIGFEAGCQIIMSAGDPIQSTQILFKGESRI